MVNTHEQPLEFLRLWRKCLVPDKQRGSAPLQGTSFAIFVLLQYCLVFFLAVFYIIARPLFRSEDSNHTLYVVVALAVTACFYAVPQLYATIGSIVGFSWQVVRPVIAAAFLVGATFLTRYDIEELYFGIWAEFIASTAFTQTRSNY